MGIIEILLQAVGLSMDASAVGMSNGLAENKMKPGKMLLIAGAFGIFQGLMPAIGYLLGSLFAGYVTAAAPFVALALLGFLGVRMIIEAVKEIKAKKEGEEQTEAKPLTFRTVLLQAVATSIDALAVGVSLAFTDAQGLLALPFWLCCLIICAVTFVFSLIAIVIGKASGTALADKATLVGGIILIGIGLKIFIEGLIELLG